MNPFFRVKDYKTVYCLMRIVLRQMFEKAAELGTNIKAVYSKVFSIYSTLVNINFLSQTDRPGSQFLNISMIASYSG